MNKRGYFIIGGGILFLGILFLINKKIAKKTDSISDDTISDTENDTENNSSEKEAGKILFLGGLDDKIGYKKLSQQENLIKKGLRIKMDIDSFRYTNSTGILNAIKNNPTSYIILFSAGAKHSESIAKEVLKNNGDLKKLYIIEPYNDYSYTFNSVNNAVKLGVPDKNVWVGNKKSVGLGIIENPKKTPKCLPFHWCSLTEFGKFI